MSQPDVVVVVLDTLRRDHVGAFGNEWIDTGAIDEFAADPNTVSFTEAYPEAMPTMPIREGLMTGMRTLPYHFWEPLDEEHPTLAELLRREGYVTAIVSDNPHMAKPRMNYQRGFDAFQWIRGQENDKYRTAPATTRCSCGWTPSTPTSPGIRRRRTAAGTPTPGTTARS
jgi:arylsulfatase A-like enzyme